VLHGYGRSAQPVNDGLCCTQCNHAHVIPARLARLQARDAKRESNGAVKTSKHLAGSNKSAGPAAATNARTIEKQPRRITPFADLPGGLGGQPPGGQDRRQHQHAL